MDRPNLNDLVFELRDLINVPRRRSKLMLRPDAFGMICSAMDAIGDAQLAIEAHTRLVGGAALSDADELYLAHFGLVASLGIQHDSTKDLCKALGFSDLLSSVDVANRFAKDIRNDVMHQSNRAGGKRFWSLERAGMMKQGFRLYGYDLSGGRLAGQWVDCPGLIARQAAALGEILDKSIERLKNEDRAHRARYRGDVLSRIFQGLEYAVESVKTASIDPDRSEHAGAASIRSLREMTERLGVKLKERGEDENAKESLADALAVLARAEEHCHEGEENIDFRGVALLVEVVMVELREHAIDVDRDYAEP